MTKIPVWMRTSVSAYTLRKHPQYKHIFRRCVVCDRLSLKPFGLSQIKDIKKVLNWNEWRCSLCGYSHVTNLVAYNTSRGGEEKNINVSEGRILEEESK